MFQMASIGPMFGQLGYFHKFAGREIEDKRPLERYRGESKRLLGVLETRLAGRTWIMGEDYTIADIAMLGWVRNLVGFYGAGELVDYEQLQGSSRPGSSAASRVPPCSAGSTSRSGPEARAEPLSPARPLGGGALIVDEAV